MSHNKRIRPLPIPASLRTQSETQQEWETVQVENSWLVEPEFVPFVQNCWGMYINVNIMGKMDYCAEDFSYWDKEHGQKNHREIEKVRRKLELI